MPNYYFIGIRLPERAAEKIGNVRNEWKLATHKKLTPPADMHITLLFIGADPNSEIEGISAALSGIRQTPFDLKVNGVKTFGNPSTPRIVYAAVEENKSLHHLHSQIKETVRQFNVSADDKPFVPHITLAAKWAGGLPMDSNLPLAEIDFHVSEFTLFQIMPNSNPKYFPLATYQLNENIERRDSEVL